MNWRYFILFFITIFKSYDFYAQICSPAFNFKIENRQTTSVDLSWSDLNASPLGWEIELVIKGQTRTGIPNLPIINEKSTKLTGLTPSTSYELSIRTVCDSNRKSNWNTIPFTTVVEVPSACQINIPLKDNGTEILFLDVKENGILGKDIFLESVDLILEHSWPADLSITLESPQGQRLLLTNHNGTASVNFGDSGSNDCTKHTTFALDACSTLQSSRPPYIGIFKPDGNISNWKQDTLSKGLWKLIVFDRALKDVGTLKYINLNFNRENCIVPANFAIEKTDIESITLVWDYMHPCSSAVITLTVNGLPFETKTVPCQPGRYTYENLLPNTEYEISISSNCSFTSVSQESCIIKASTTCEPISVAESFDTYPRCDEGCNTPCTWNNSLWYNAKDDNEQDWIIWRGKTDTENTGPNGDINDLGQYLYIENNPELCEINNEVILQSKCMQILSNASGCDMSFYYHMYGIDTEILTLEISTDNGETWNNLFMAQGDQGNQWKRATISLMPYDKMIGIFRFKAISGKGVLSDIALDQIEFYKSIPLTNNKVYYQDKDGDGFGNEAVKIEICASFPPIGYVDKAGDCDDNNPSINPDAIEIQCNNIDENCNGNLDDQPSFNPIKVNQSITHASCNGSTDGAITLDITGGTSPYTISWSNGATGPLNENLKIGVYFATVTDAGGCIISTDFYQINALTNLNIIVTEMTQASCKGKSDAVIKIAHNNEHPPYNYLWSNGNTTQHLENISEGTYNVTVTDQNQCFAILNNLNVTSRPSLLVDIKNKRNPFCFGQNTGSIELITINGTPPYHYRWNNGNTNETINMLAPDTYNCTVTDMNGCINEFTTEIVSPTKIEIKVVSIESVRCFDESNGSIKTNATGGKPPYTYLWSKQSERTDDIFDLEAGAYTLTVTDANGCNVSTPPIVVTQPPILDIEIDSLAPASCFLGRNGYVRLLTTGGMGTYNFVWSHSSASTSQFDNLMSGNYSVTAFDLAGCKASLPNIAIGYENKPVKVDLQLIQDSRCYKDSIAKISVSLSNGKPTFDYNWSHGVQYFSTKLSDTLHQLQAGTYQLTVTDIDGCVGIGDPISISAKEPFYYTVLNLMDNVCQRDSSGSIMIEINGGTKPIGVSWNGGLFSGAHITHLANGVYAAQIIDAHDCRINVLPLTISSWSEIGVIPNIINSTNQSNNGQICIDIHGGHQPYVIQWSNGVQNQSCINNLSAGQYSVTIIDNIECEWFETFTVENTTSTENIEITPSITIFPNPTNDYINIRSNKVINEVKILDTNGRLIKYFDGKQDQIPLHDITSGLYILQVHTDLETKVFKIVKRQI